MTLLNSVTDKGFGSVQSSPRPVGIPLDSWGRSRVKRVARRPLIYSPGDGLRWSETPLFLGEEAFSLFSGSGNWYCKSRAALLSIRRPKPGIFSIILLDTLVFLRVTAKSASQETVSG